MAKFFHNISMRSRNIPPKMVGFEGENHPPPVNVICELDIDPPLYVSQYEQLGDLHPPEQHLEMYEQLWLNKIVTNQLTN